ncbi:MAG: hypothetical protein PHN84_00265 [Desulfuromonadaceae bacterium]|nr:hypothetical protein [Desulfuromonadaceae bacterium]MDD2855372.1 hypothetical protein [Desulfuromonadaceae bacterium]
MYSLFKICINIAHVLALVFLTGCAASSTFTPYPDKIQPLINSLSNRTLLDTSKTLQSESKGKDQILYNMELGRYSQLTGDISNSMSDFSRSIEKNRENDEKSLISASGVGSNLAAIIVNDNAIPYEAEGYERVLLHHYQALNYLRKNDLEGAGVEVRRANSEQNDSLKRFEKELLKSEKEAADKRVDSNNVSNIASKYAQMDEVAGRVKNSFQNAYTFYISAFIYELLKQPNDAYIDYKKALEIYPENRYLQKDVLRLAKILDMREELDELKKRFSIEEHQFDIVSEETGELLVIFEDGFAPRKHEIKIPIPAGRGGIVTIAFPIYQEKWSNQLPLHIFNNNSELGSTEPICDIRALAVKALEEKIPMIAVRQIIRAVAKGVTSAEAKKRAGDLGELAAILWNIVSESADLRSWLTLPSNAQILRTNLPTGSYRLNLKHPMTDGAAHLDLNVTPESKSILFVNRAGRQLYSSVMQF